MDSQSNFEVAIKSSKDPEMIEYSTDTRCFSDISKMKSVSESGNFSILFKSKNPGDRLYLDNLSEYADNYINPPKHSDCPLKDNRFLSKEKNYEDLLFFERKEDSQIPKSVEICINDQKHTMGQLTPKIYGFRVISSGRVYYYAINVGLKDTAFDSNWVEMRRYLINKLSKNIITKDNGFKLLYYISGDKKNDNQVFAQTSNIIDNYQKLIMALKEIIDGPRFQIKKDYTWVNSDKRSQVDRHSIINSVKKPNKHLVVDKVLNFDIPTNQYLKFMLIQMQKFINKRRIFYVDLKKNKYSIDQKNFFESHLNKLDFINQLISRTLNVGVMKNVKEKRMQLIPKPIILDPVYNNIFRQYLNITSKYFDTKLEQIENIIWQPTDNIYELWTYFHLIDLLTSEYGGYSNMDSDVWGKNILDNLESLNDQRKQVSQDINKNGKQKIEISTKLKFNENGPILKVIYQKDLRRTYSTDFYTKSGHFNPDILIEICNPSSVVVGGIVLDAKYKTKENCINYYPNSDNEWNKDVTKLVSYKEDVVLKNKESLKAITAVYALLPNIHSKKKQTAKKYTEKKPKFLTNSNKLEQYLKDTKDIFPVQFAPDQKNDREFIDELKERINQTVTNYERLFKQA